MVLFWVILAHTLPSLGGLKMLVFIRVCKVFHTHANSPNGTGFNRGSRHVLWRKWFGEEQNNTIIIRVSSMQSRVKVQPRKG